LTDALCSFSQTNLKKQGLLPLTFANPKDYDRIRPRDKLSLLMLNQLCPGRPVQCLVSFFLPCRLLFSLFFTVLPFCGFSSFSLKVSHLFFARRQIHPSDKSAPFTILLNHTFNDAQIRWFKAGSALNYMNRAKRIEKYA
jgi:aconitate hydratase